MVVNLNNEYYIEQIPYNYVLRRAGLSLGTGKDKSEKPKMVVTDCGFYPTVQAAVEGFIKLTQSQRSADFNGNLMEYVKRIDDITTNAVEEIKRTNLWK